MDIFSLRERAQADDLAARVQTRDRAWERGPVGIVLRADILRDLGRPDPPAPATEPPADPSSCAACDVVPCRCSATGT